MSRTGPRSPPRVRRTTPADRGRTLRRLAAALDAQREDLARLETLDTGKPLSLARSEVAGCVAYLEYYAGAADKLQGETIPLGPGSLAWTVREPVGVTAHIVPWNAPLSMLCRSVAPALAAGNSAVVKMKITYGNGETEEDDQQMKLVDGKWLMSIDK